MKAFLKLIGQFFEVVAFCVIVGIFYCLTFRTSSALGSWLGRHIGPILGANKRVRRNLKLALPELSSIEHDAIIKGMWDNLGRTFAEYPHLHKIDIFGPASPVKIEGLEILKKLKKSHKSVIFVLGHLANWEFATLPAKQKGFKIAQVYRRVNNPFISKLVRRIHGNLVDELVEKGADGARQLIDVIQREEHLSVLMDQKMNEGLPIPFFGYPAMTAPAIARLAVKYKCPILPVQVVRTDKTHFLVTYHSPILPDKPVERLLSEINASIETWIRAHPDQWFWLHRRWPNEVYTQSEKFLHRLEK
ncbi:lysophospholipid acyltransferase family protein [Candidatus Nucleicultrix amoebiphila]|jgi:KDO2-lipid IV(A) lauroyltransferase|uniref:lysophospholipid acyltransferase family protein n=1 Tax=Candidatus Nucleicultrix amoebiphila TaxID=1509244 RepID=UPI000A268429|nr:hypothetical protein [Candidatus Nucleicultrix amoebiphila]